MLGWFSTSRKTTLMTRKFLQACGVVGTGQAAQESLGAGRTSVVEALLFLTHTTLISHPGMTSPSNEARIQLRDARDALCVSQLFANHPFTADDATNALEDSHVTPDPALIRVLLQHGADVNALSIRKVTWSKHPTELLRLLAEYGYDFKPYSHCILQSVASPGSH